MIGFALANWRWLLPAIGIVAALAWGGIEHTWRVSLERDIARSEAEARAAILAAQQKAEDLSNELIIAQAQAMAVTEKKVIEYVDRIRTVQAPDTACPSDERMRIGSHGVRDIIRGGSAAAPE